MTTKNEWTGFFFSFFSTLKGKASERPYSSGWHSLVAEEQGREGGRRYSSHGEGWYEIVNWLLEVAAERYQPDVDKTTTAAARDLFDLHSHVHVDIGYEKALMGT